MMVCSTVVHANEPASYIYINKQILQRPLPGPLPRLLLTSNTQPCHSCYPCHLQDSSHFAQDYLSPFFCIPLSNFISIILSPSNIIHILLLYLAVSSQLICKLHKGRLIFTILLISSLNTQNIAHIVIDAKCIFIG